MWQISDIHPLPFSEYLLKQVLHTWNITLWACERNIARGTTDPGYWPREAIHKKVMFLRTGGIPDICPFLLHRHNFWFNFSPRKICLHISHVEKFLRMTDFFPCFSTWQIVMWRICSTKQSVMWRNFSTWQIFLHRHRKSKTGVFWATSSRIGSARLKSSLVWSGLV